MRQTVTFADLIGAGVLEIGDGYRAKLNELGGDGPIFLRAASVSDGSIDYDGNGRDEFIVMNGHLKAEGPIRLIAFR